MKKDKKHTLFIIEDNEAYTFMLKYKLQKYQKYKIISFKSCEEFIEKINYKPDIILLDYKLLSGCTEEVLDAIKLYSQKVPFIILSLREETTPILNLMKEGAFEYIIKEEDSTELTNKLIVKIVSIINREETIKLKTQRIQTVFTLVLLIIVILIICWIVY